MTKEFKPTVQRQNANRHTQRGMGLLEKSIAEDGWIGAITVAADGETFDGSARLEVNAANFDGVEPIIVRSKGDRPIIHVREDIPTADDPRAVKLGVAANAIANINLAWEPAVLTAIAAEGVALDGMFTALEWADVAMADPSEATDEPPPLTPEAARATLAERFLVPPFSVLDARQGYWQERKRAWLALGIQSELGRGNANLTMSHPATTATIDFYAQKRQIESELGRTISTDEAKDILAERGDLKDDLAQNAERFEAIPGGAGASSVYRDHGRSARASGIAQTSGQDLMRGEGTNVLPGKMKGNPHPVLLSHAARDAGALASRQAAAKGVGQGVAHPFVDIVGARDTLPDQTGLSANQSGTSIFDPVLCELVYRWFSPPDGAVLDPFAGGSVRGIVAGRIGRAYTGIDLRAEQIAANEAQAAALFTEISTGDTVQVKISAAMARLRFNGCDPEYIRTTCHASCCQSSTSPTGTVITIHPSEVDVITARGGVVKDGLLQPRPGERRCSFKTDDHLCGLHFTPDKPFGCIASPFTLNENNTLIVRNRYKLLKCYEDGPRLPAYQAFRTSLDLIFGTAEAQRIADHFDAGGGDILATMLQRSFAMLKENDDIKHGRMNDHPLPRWIVGDSQHVATLAPGSYDLVFSCPPYADLEVYSDDPADISTMDYPAFLAMYRTIIAESVALLKPDRFCCFVVGDVRDKKGLYRNFVSDTIAAFQDAGAALYNEAILVTSVGSLPIRVGKQFESGRKLGKTHQNVLVFIKGDAKRATLACGPVEVAGIEDEGLAEG